MVRKPHGSAIGAALQLADDILDGLMRPNDLRAWDDVIFSVAKIRPAHAQALLDAIEAGIAKRARDDAKPVRTLTEIWADAEKARKKEEQSNE